MAVQIGTRGSARRYTGGAAAWLRGGIRDGPKVWPESSDSSFEWDGSTLCESEPRYASRPVGRSGVMRFGGRNGMPTANLEHRKNARYSRPDQDTRGCQSDIMITDICYAHT